MSYQVMRVRGLHCITRDFVIRWLCSCRFQSGHDVSAVYQYLLPATPLLEDLAVSCRYYRDPHLTQLFLPILILKGRIHITSANIKEVLDYWKSTKHGVLVPFTHLKVEDAEGMQYFSFLPFLGHLTNLQVLVVGSLVGDDLLAVLGINCCHLMIFDAREDTGSLISDVGLAYLAQCKKLRCVYFSVFANEYDCAIEQLGFSGKGVALLLLLPEIEHVQCSEYLLRDAIHFLYQTNYHKKTIAIQCILLDHQEVNVSTLQMLPFFCPKLEVLALRSEAGNDKIVGKAIKALPHLKMLIMTVGSVCRFKDLTFSSYGPQLTYLYLTTYLLDSQDLIMLSQACSQLKTFILKMHSFGFDVSSTSNVGSLFPTVEKLELLQNISVRLFKVLNMKMQNLKEVHCTWALVCADVSMPEIFDHQDKNPHLENINMPDEKPKQESKPEVGKKSSKVKQHREDKKKTDKSKKKVNKKKDRLGKKKDSGSSDDSSSDDSSSDTSSDSSDSDSSDSDSSSSSSGSSSGSSSDSDSDSSSSSSSGSDSDSDHEKKKKKKRGARLSRSDDSSSDSEVQEKKKKIRKIEEKKKNSSESGKSSKGKVKVDHGNKTKKELGKKEKHKDKDGKGKETHKVKEADRGRERDAGHRKEREWAKKGGKSRSRERKRERSRERRRDRSRSRDKDRRGSRKDRR